MRIVTRGFGVGQGGYIATRGFLSFFVPSDSRSITVAGRSRSRTVTNFVRGQTITGRTRSFTVKNKVTD